ncbi:MAG: PHP-associated domain-containing protein, partial [Vicinamibacteraceae bacterium]
PAHNQLAAELARSRGKVVVGGSDAHTLRRVGTTWTTAPGATREEFLANVAAGRGRVGGVHGGTFQLAADIYGVIAQYWLSLVGLRRHELTLPRRMLGAGFSLATLPGEFVPLIVAARSKQREARWVASSARALGIPSGASARPAEIEAEPGL